jgi:hypothetical protein
MVERTCPPKRVGAKAEPNPSPAPDMPTLEQWLALVLGLVLIGFIVFAFRKGTQVKPDDRREDQPPAGPDDGPHA